MHTAPLKVEIATRVVAARNAAGVSQEALAEKAGIALRTLARREAGIGRGWDTDEIDAVAAALNVSRASLWPTEVAS